MSARNPAAAIVAISCMGAVAVISADASDRPPARILVYAQEWSLWPSRSSLPAGRVIVELRNRGQDAHDLRIRRLTGHDRMTGSTQAVAVTLSGAISQASWRLKPGSYELYCSMPDHFKRGMHVRLVVR